MKKLLLRYGLLHDERYVRAYWWSGEGNTNFGDIVTPYLIEKMSGKKALLCSPYCLRDFFLMTGSIIRRACARSIVWGSGLMFRDQEIKKPKVVHAVRGPLTRTRLLELGYDCPEVYGDPALLLPRYYSPQLEKRWEVGIIPHFIDFPEVQRSISDERIRVINLLAPVEEVVDQILRCEWTLSSSLHGVIVSHTYGIPSRHVQFSDKIAGDGTKFSDYFLSVGIEPYKPVTLKMNKLSYGELVSMRQETDCTIEIDLDGLHESCPLV